MAVLIRKSLEECKKESVELSNRNTNAFCNFLEDALSMGHAVHITCRDNEEFLVIAKRYRNRSGVTIGATLGGVPTGALGIAASDLIFRLPWNK